jgi:phage-related protein
MRTLGELAREGMNANLNKRQAVEEPLDAKNFEDGDNGIEPPIGV